MIDDDDEPGVLRLDAGSWTVLIREHSITSQFADLRIGGVVGKLHPELRDHRCCGRVHRLRIAQPSRVG